MKLRDKRHVENKIDKKKMKLVNKVKRITAKTMLFHFAVTLPAPERTGSLAGERRVCLCSTSTVN